MKHSTLRSKACSSPSPGIMVQTNKGKEALRHLGDTCRARDLLGWLNTAGVKRSITESGKDKDKGWGLGPSSPMQQRHTAMGTCLCNSAAINPIHRCPSPSTTSSLSGRKHRRSYIRSHWFPMNISQNSIQMCSFKYRFNSAQWLSHIKLFVVVVELTVALFQNWLTAQISPHRTGCISL